jgi:opacity protein-like surface antigen
MGVVVSEARTRIMKRLVPMVLALALLVVDALPGAAQWADVARWLDNAQPVTLGLEASRFRVSTLGTKSVIAIEDPSSASPPYRFIDPDLRGTGISLDLKLRWPTPAGVRTSGFGAVEPYFLVGPMLFASGADGASRAGQSGPRSEGGLSLGLSWGAGLAWRFARNAELFGGYRFMQHSRESSSHGERTSSDSDLIGHDVLYGISVRF